MLSRAAGYAYLISGVSAHKANSAVICKPISTNFTGHPFVIVSHLGSLRSVITTVRHVCTSSSSFWDSNASHRPLSSISTCHLSLSASISVVTSHPKTHHPVSQLTACEQRAHSIKWRCQYKGDYNRSEQIWLCLPKYHRAPMEEDADESGTNF